MPRMLDLFCGRGGWTNAFLARGWECVGIDLNQQPEYRGAFMQWDILMLEDVSYLRPDFICASSPCEEFSVHGMKHFHPSPKYPDLGIKLFNHTRAICEKSAVPYVMENVRPAQQFVGRAVHHCGPFYLWGPGVPALLPQGIKKGFNTGGSIISKYPREEARRLIRELRIEMGDWNNSRSPERAAHAAKVVTIPPELANCVADYAERIICVKAGE